MIRTQIQLPDELYRKVKLLAEQRELSLAEIVRRGLEYILRVYPQTEQPRDDWSMPGPLNVGLNNDFFKNRDWRDEINMGSGALGMIREDRRVRYGRKRAR